MLRPRRDRVRRSEGTADLPSWEWSVLREEEAAGLQLTVLFLTVLFATAL